jgi:hypothetical protein
MANIECRDYFICNLDLFSALSDLTCPTDILSKREGKKVKSILRG